MVLSKNGGTQGQLPNPYFYVWKKKVTDVHGAVDVKIPSTVVYEYDFPKAWYFWSKSKEEVERRVGKEVDTPSIFAEFTKKSGHDTDIVASWLTAGEGEQTKAEFFDKEALHEFLTKRKKRGHGVLQKFVPPTGQNNATIQAIWTPHVVLVEKRQNVQALDDTRCDMASRCITYEGPLHISRPSFLAPHVDWKVREVCRQLTSHILDVEGTGLSQMTLYFRASKNGDLWLLWCSQMTTADKDTGLGGGTSEKASTQPFPDIGSSMLKDLRTAVDKDLEMLDNNLSKLPSMGAIGDTYFQTLPRAPRRRKQLPPSNGPSPVPPSYDAPGVRSKMNMYSRVPPQQCITLLGKQDVQDKLNAMAEASDTDYPIWLKGDCSTSEDDLAVSMNAAPQSANRAASFKKAGTDGPGLVPTPPPLRSRTLSVVSRTSDKAPQNPVLAGLLKQLNEFVDHVGYSSYSHFLCSPSGYVFSMPDDLDAILGDKFLEDFAEFGIKRGSVPAEYVWKKPKGLMSAIPHRFEAWASIAEEHLKDSYNTTGHFRVTADSLTAPGADAEAKAEADASLPAIEAAA